MKRSTRKFVHTRERALCGETLKRKRRGGGEQRWGEEKLTNKIKKKSDPGRPRSLKRKKKRERMRRFFLYNEGGTATTIALYVDVKGFFI